VLDTTEEVLLPRIKVGGAGCEGKLIPAATAATAAAAAATAVLCACKEALVPCIKVGAGHEGKLAPAAAAAAVLCTCKEALVPCITMIAGFGGTLAPATTPGAPAAAVFMHTKGLCVETDVGC